VCQHFGLPLQIDFGVDVGRVDGNVGWVATMHGKSSWGTCTFASMNASCMNTISAIYGKLRIGLAVGRGLSETLNV
jgi:hypothetical protein